MNLRRVVVIAALAVAVSSCLGSLPRPRSLTTTDLAQGGPEDEDRTREDGDGGPVPSGPQESTAPPESSPAGSETTDALESISVPLGELGEEDFGGEREPIEMLTVLRLAGAKHIEVKIHEERLRAARADVTAAGARFLPDLMIGAGYVRHDGRLQETRGEVFDVSRSSLGAGPFVHLHTDPAEAYFERLRALQVAKAAGHGRQRARAEVMVSAAWLYLDLVEARALVEVASEAVEHSKEQEGLSRQAVELQAELRVNLLRARAARARDEQRLLAARNDLRRASVELAVHLRLPPTTLLVPAEDTVRPMTLIDPETGLGTLTSMAIEGRPDLRELEALSRAARERLSGEEIRPWIPEIDLFAGYGTFGGGRGSDFQDFGDRLDAGATVNWSFEGLGFGVGARQRRARSEAREAALRVEGLREKVVGQVIRSWERVRSLRAGIDAASARVEASREALDLVRVRFSANDAIQLEILEALSELAESRAAIIQAIIEYNKVQHLLHYQVHGAAWGT